LDEVEKAHPDVFHILLQLLDEGRLTDSQGRVVDFKNTIVIMTSNIGSAHLVSGLGADGEWSETVRDNVMRELSNHFRPEFLNRVDDIVLFKPLSLTEIGQIVRKLVEHLQDRLKDRQITLQLTDEAVQLIAEQGFDPAYGARPLKRFIQRALETKVARAMIAGEASEGSTVIVNVVDQELHVVIQSSPSADRPAEESPEAISIG